MIFWRQTVIICPISGKPLFSETKGPAEISAVPTPVERHVGNAARVALETQINYIMFGEKNAVQALADAEAEIRKLVATAEAKRR
jgi:hypothetical protein